MVCWEADMMKKKRPCNEVVDSLKQLVGDRNSSEYDVNILNIHTKNTTMY